MRNWLVIAASLLAGVWLMVVPVARAGEWVQRSCSYGTEFIEPEGWQGIEENGFKNPLQGRPFDGCLGFNNGGGLEAIAAGAYGDQPHAGESWLYKAPHDSTIAGGTLTAKLTASNGDAVIGAWAKNGLVTLANCEKPDCSIDGGLVPITAIGGTELYEKASCNPTDGPFCPSESNFAAEVIISSAQILLSTDATPTGSGFSGTLLSDPTSGTGTLSFTATDPGPGVFQAKVEIDGQPVWSATPSLNEGKCVMQETYEGARAFNHAQPCPTETAVSAAIDTTSLAEGQHKLTVEVEDAAGNVAKVYEATITVANHPTAAMTTLVAPTPARGPANGSPASEDATVAAHWHGTSSTTLTSPYGRSRQIEGRLTDSAGAPIAGALIEASQKPASLGAAASSLTGPRTNPQGNFTISVPRTSSSTSIELAYRSHIGDLRPVATKTLTLQVLASVHLKVSPHVTSVGHTIVLRGTLAGHIPPGGKKVLFEARSPGGPWIEFHNATVNAHGRFRATHRFTFPGPVDYQFRVVCEHEADFPFLTSTSNIVHVREL